MFLVFGYLQKEWKKRNKLNNYWNLFRMISKDVFNYVIVLIKKL